MMTKITARITMSVELPEEEFDKIITAENEGQLNMLEKIFAHMQYLGGIGSSRKFTVFCDGDGAVRLKFQSHNEDEFIFRDLDYDECMNKDSGYGRYEINDKDGVGNETYFDLG